MLATDVVRLADWILTWLVGWDLVSLRARVGVAAGAGVGVAVASGFGVAAGFGFGMLDRSRPMSFVLTPV